LLGFLFGHEGAGDIFFQNTGPSPDYMTLKPRLPPSLVITMRTLNPVYNLIKNDRAGKFSTQLQYIEDLEFSVLWAT
jgi:hypothetical protein